MARTTPLVEDSILTYFDSETGKKITSIDISNPEEVKYWERFLRSENEKSFRYRHTTKGGFVLTYSAYKEKRKHPYGEFYVWIAQKRVKGKLRKAYLGKNANLTVKKLRETARKINQGKFT